MARILILEDSPLVQDLMREVLTRRGHEVAVCDRVEAARSAIEASLPDLLIADVGLPDGSGLELVARLRERFDEHTLPVIVLSGMGTEEDLLHGFAVGANDYLTKPVSNAELLAKCAMLLARRRPSPQSAPSGGPEAQAMGEHLPGGAANAFGRYRITGLLGQGGAGVVYRAEDHAHDGREVALKVPGLPTTAAHRQRFTREVYLLSSLEHPSVVRVYDFGTGEGRLYCAMERVEGSDLAEYVRERGPISERETVMLLRALTDALGCVSEAGLLHRDIKPRNVILREDDLSTPVLVDFGLAKQPEDRSLTKTGELIGTPGYMAPEVLKGERPTVRSDLFALGLLARFGLTGEEVFPDQTGMALLTALATCPVTIPSTVSPGLGAVLERLTRIRPEERYPDPAALQEALSEL